jgi:hypothetical protein
LKQEDWPGFRRIRARIAAMLAHNHILAGRGSEARGIVNRFGNEMPATWSTHLLQWGNRLGGAGWLAACNILRLRDLQKGFTLNARARFLSSGDSRKPSTRCQ